MWVVEVLQKGGRSSRGCSRLSSLGGGNLSSATSIPSRGHFAGSLTLFDRRAYVIVDGIHHVTGLHVLDSIHDIMHFAHEIGDRILRRRRRIHGIIPGRCACLIVLLSFGFFFLLLALKLMIPFIHLANLVQLAGQILVLVNGGAEVHHVEGGVVDRVCS